MHAAPGREARLQSSGIHVLVSLRLIHPRLLSLEPVVGRVIGTLPHDCDFHERLSYLFPLHLARTFRPLPDCRNGVGETILIPRMFLERNS